MPAVTSFGFGSAEIVRSMPHGPSLQGSPVLERYLTTLRLPHHNTPGQVSKYKQYLTSVSSADTDNCSCFVVPFVGLSGCPVNGIFQRRRQAIVVFRASKQESISACNLLSPSFHIRWKCKTCATTAIKKMTKSLDCARRPMTLRLLVCAHVMQRSHHIRSP